VQPGQALPHRRQWWQRCDQHTVCGRTCAVAAGCLPGRLTVCKQEFVGCSSSSTVVLRGWHANCSSRKKNSAMQHTIMLLTKQKQATRVCSTQHSTPARTHTSHCASHLGMMAGLNRASISQRTPHHLHNKQWREASDHRHHHHHHHQLTLPAQASHWAT
jgi:hypothetical protein